MKTRFAIAMAAILVSVGAFLALFHANGQPPAGKPSADEVSLRAAVEQYTASLKTGDLKAILAHWTADGDFIDEEGAHHKGKDALGKLYEENLKDLKEGKSAFAIESVRMLSPDVAVIIGMVEFTPKDGAVETNRVTATWVKQAGRWLIASVRDLPEQPGDAADRDMKAMKFLVGDWTAEGKGLTVKLNVKLGMGDKFAFLNFDIKKAKESLTVLQIVGHDPTEGILRSWAFDSAGGFSEGEWIKEGGAWIGEMVGVLPNGQVGAATNTIVVTGPNSITFQSKNREVDGVFVPDHELKYTRVVTK